MNKIQYLKNFNITTKFILWFLFVALFPLVIAISISYDNSQKALKREVTNSLVAIADYKASEIEAFLADKEKNASYLSNNSDIIEIMRKFNYILTDYGTGSPEHESLSEEHRPFFNYYRKLFGYDDILLICENGDLAFSAIKRNDFTSIYELALNSPSELSNIFIKVKKSLKIEISDFEYSDLEGQAALFIASPLFRGPDFIGVIIFQMGNQSITDLIKDCTRFGETAETIVASKISNEIVIITPIRFDANSAFKRKISLDTKEDIYLKDAVEGKDGVGIFTDYRGKSVLSAWRHLPSFRWGMAVKMDTFEVFRSATQLRSTLFKVGFILLVLVVIMAVIIAKSVSSPIKSLTEVSKIISSGELSARAEVNAQDEIGDLAISFNQMTDNLIEAKAIVEEKKNQLEMQKNLLEKANKELDSFVYTVSHDLRTPLNGINGFAELLEKDYFGKLDTIGQEYVVRIHKAAERMKRLIEDLLTLSKISRIENPFEDVDIKILIDSVLERVEFEIRKNNVEINVATGLPVVHCDRIKLEEALLNLVTNAIKFSSKNNPGRPKVDIGYREAGEYHEFYVKDNGIGIDKKYHDEIFEIFRRLHHQKDYDGTGAGLSIVKRVIDDHQGRIWVDSEPGKGAAFYFTIPKKELRKKKIGEILIEEGSVTKDSLKSALKKQGIDYNPT